MKLSVLIASALVATAPFASFAATSLAHSDVSFMKDAAEAGEAEIEASKLAETKAMRPETKAFAQQMITDHTKVGDELKQLAAAKQVTLPTKPSITQQAEIKMIDMGDNAKFDARYAKDIGVKAHEDAVKLFQKAANDAKDPDVKAFAQKNLPALTHHLDMARKLASGDTTAAMNTSGH